MAALEQAGIPPPVDEPDESEPMDPRVTSFVNALMARHLGCLALSTYKTGWQVEQMQSEIRLLQAAPRLQGHR